MENNEINQIKKAITTFCGESATSKELEIYTNSL